MPDYDFSSQKTTFRAGFSKKDSAVTVVTPKVPVALSRGFVENTNEDLELQMNTIEEQEYADSKER